MRNLIVLRGPEYSGRHEFIQANNLDSWLVDQQVLEGLFTEPVTDPLGGYRSDPLLRTQLRNRVLHILEGKMARGALIIFRPSDTGAPFTRNAVSASDRMIEAVIALGKRYRYDTRIIDFTNTFPAAEIEARRQAAGRNPQANEIARVISHLRRRTGLSDIEGVIWHEAAQIDSLLDLIEPDVVDLGRWHNIVAIGDIHGCSRTLAKLTDNFEIRQDTAYIFLGDYINKGPCSGSVLQALLTRFMPQPNCFFLTGNHERHLDDWGRGATVTKKTFRATTLPSLESARFTQSDALTFLDRTIDAGRFHWRGLDILATHGGFARPPEALAPLSVEHFQMGTDGARFDTDTAWEKKCDR